MCSDKKRESAIIYLQDVFKNKILFDKLKCSELFLVNEYLSKKDISVWNKCLKSNCLPIDFLSKENVEVMFFILHLSKIIKFNLNKLNNWNEEYTYFKKNFLWNCNKMSEKYFAQLSIEKENHKKSEENQFISDVSSGIFDSTESRNRMLFSSVYNVNYSQKFLNINNKLNYVLKQGISFIYLKLEEISFIAFNLTRTRKPKEKIYLRDKYFSFDEIYFIKNKLDDNDEKTMLKILKFANHYKHQAELDFDIIDIKLIKKFFVLLDKLYLLLFDTLNSLKLFCDNINSICDDYESATNPLGLTGFE
ncbi:MAG: hypothetical protein ACRDA7_01665 [Metamycoplasmataceae bacterium]